MIKMEKTCGSPKCSVMHEGKLIGHMDGVGLIQWFLKNKYCYRGSFSRFITDDIELNRQGITVDIIFLDKKLMAKNAKIEWLKAPCKNGTFIAKNIEYCEV